MRADGQIDYVEFPAGGTIIVPLDSFPGGRRFRFTDPAGNDLAVSSESAPPA